MFLENSSPFFGIQFHPNFPSAERFQFLMSIGVHLSFFYPEKTMKNSNFTSVRFLISCLLVGVTTLNLSLYSTHAAHSSRTPNSPEYPSWLQDRWFYSSLSVHSEEQTEELIQVIQTAGKNDLNGLLWATGFDYCGKWSPEVRERFTRIKSAAAEAGVEIIPIIWSVGYGTMLGRNPNLVESVPIRDLRVIARGGKVELDPEEEAYSSPYGGFEEFSGNRPLGFQFADKPGTISFRDTEVKHSGSSSLRLENFTADKHGHGRVLMKLKVTPNRSYRVKIWFKTESLPAQGLVRFQIYGPNGSWVSIAPKLPENGTQDWTEASLNFTTGTDDTEVNFYAGVWDGTEGKVWLDDISLESSDMTAPVMRPGTPLTVKNAETGETYELGKDYLPEPLRIWDFQRGIAKSPIRIPEGSRIPENARLSLSFYVPSLSIKGQTSVCMSEPELYEHFEASAKDIMELLAPKKWFLSMDEIRSANTCESCEKRGISLAEILGGCLTRQYEIIQKVQPGAQVYVWSDMLDPHHNCRADYMRCRGDFTGVWEHIPKELIISCWYHKIREKSMSFFSEKGFRTQAAAYYDVDSLDTSREWLETCELTPNCTGIMYTTWRKKYELMKDFGKMLQQKRLQEVPLPEK